MKRQIAKLEKPGLQCVDLVFEELQRITERVEPKQVEQYGELRARLKSVVCRQLQHCVKPTKEMISNQIKIELAYINTNHPDFIGGLEAMRLTEKSKAENNMDGRKDRSVSTASQESGKTSPPGDMRYTLFGPENGIREKGHQGTTSDQDEMASQSSSSHFVAKQHGAVSVTTTTGGHYLNLMQIKAEMNRLDLPLSVREKSEIRLIKALVASYFGHQIFPSACS